MLRTPHPKEPTPLSDQIPRYLRQIIGFATSMEAHHQQVMENAADMRPGHPRAQDFEPTGHGGSDPTAQNAIRPNTVVRDMHNYRQGILNALDEVARSMGISERYRDAQRPKRMPADANEVLANVCRMHARFDEYRDIEAAGLCKACYRRQLWQRENGFGDLTVEQVGYYCDPTNMGRWPKMHAHQAKPRTEHIVVETAADAARALTAGQHLASVDNLALRLDTAST